MNIMEKFLNIKKRILKLALLDGNQAELKLRLEAYIKMIKDLEEEHIIDKTSIQFAVKKTSKYARAISNLKRDENLILATEKELNDFLFRVMYTWCDKSQIARDFTRNKLTSLAMMAILDQAKLLGLTVSFGGVEGAFNNYMESFDKITPMFEETKVESLKINLRMVYLLIINEIDSLAVPRIIFRKEIKYLSDLYSKAIDEAKSITDENNMNYFERLLDECTELYYTIEESVNRGKHVEVKHVTIPADFANSYISGKESDSIKFREVHKLVKTPVAKMAMEYILNCSMELEPAYESIVNHEADRLIIYTALDMISKIRKYNPGFVSKTGKMLVSELYKLKHQSEVFKI